VQKNIKANNPGPAVHNGVDGQSMLDDVVNRYRTPLHVLLAATGCVLLIACLNVASLLVARSAARGKEMAIRTALGGGRLRLLRERLMESLLLTAAGGAGGLLLAWGALAWLIHTRQDMNRIEAIRIDGMVVAFTLAVIVLCALFSGLIAALSANSRTLLASLQESSRSHSGGQSRATLRKAMLIVWPRLYPRFEGAGYREGRRRRLRRQRRRHRRRSQRPSGVPLRSRSHALQGAGLRFLPDRAAGRIAQRPLRRSPRHIRPPHLPRLSARSRGRPRRLGHMGLRF
jgi:hypothetical protein